MTREGLEVGRVGRDPPDAGVGLDADHRFKRPQKLVRSPQPLDPIVGQVRGLRQRLQQHARADSAEFLPLRAFAQLDQLKEKIDVGETILADLEVESTTSGLAGQLPLHPRPEVTRVRGDVRIPRSVDERADRILRLVHEIRRTGNEPAPSQGHSFPDLRPRLEIASERDDRDGEGAFLPFRSEACIEPVCEPLGCRGFHELMNCQNEPLLTLESGRVVGFALVQEDEIKIGVNRQLATAQRPSGHDRRYAASRDA